jgi:hypothetical protein
LPGIVMSHGGSPLGLTANFLRCEYSQGGVAPVDYITDFMPCMDKKEWCNDRIPNVDVRVTALNKGHVQIHASKPKGWAYVTTDEAGMTNAALAACRALGYRSLENREGSTFLDPELMATKRLACPDSAAESGKIAVRCARAARALGGRSSPSSPANRERSQPHSARAPLHARRLSQDCNVQEIAPTAGALRVECDHENIASSIYRQELCYRRTQRTNDKNHLHCDKVAGGVAVAGHTRRVGAPHVICGTAGLNESRIHWGDGYHDDYEAFSAARNPTDGSFLLSALNKGLNTARTC